MVEKVFNVNSSLSKMHIITSLHLQKEIDLKTNKTSKPSSKLSVFLSAHVPVAFKIIVKW